MFGDAHCWHDLGCDVTLLCIPPRLPLASSVQDFDILK